MQRNLTSKELGVETVISNRRGNTNTTPCEFPSASLTFQDSSDNLEIRFFDDFLYFFPSTIRGGLLDDLRKSLARHSNDGLRVVHVRRNSHGLNRWVSFYCLKHFGNTMPEVRRFLCLLHRFMNRAWDH